MENKNRPTNPPMETHFVDIHEALPEEEEEEGEEQAGAQRPEPARINGGDRVKKAPNKQFKVKDGGQRRGHRTFNRQVSLETGFSALNRDSKAEADKRVLTRSGLSLGRFEDANRLNAEARRVDFDIFRTKPALSKQNSLLPSYARRDHHHGKEADQFGQRHEGSDGLDESVNKSVPAGRYFAALRGPELDQVKDYEDILLPKDEIWPFLLRFPIGCFGICLGLSSQAVLWGALSTSPATKFLNITPYINLVLWFLAIVVLVSVSFTYVLKCIFYFEAVRREYFHPVRVNFFFAPWLVCMFLAIGAPPMVAPHRLHPALWCAFAGPYFLLELKIYGQWLSGGKRRLCKVANPSSHLSVVGNFVGAILASKVGWEEVAKFMWAVGFAHYLVVFVTLYQRLPTSEALPKELHPVYSMFIAAPSAASIAWYTIYGEFDGCSRTCFFIALFLYILLVVRINFFTGFGFSVAWWSYTFPMTTIAVATIKYAEQVPSVPSKGLALSLSFMSSAMVSVLLVSTLLHAFLWRTLFPNDLAIAITKRRLVKDRKPLKRAYDIKRWTKQALSKNKSANKDFTVEDEADYCRNVN